MELLGPPRRPCPLAAAREHDAMMRHMAAARFGPGALASLLAAAAEVRFHLGMWSDVLMILYFMFGLYSAGAALCGVGAAS